MKFTLWIRARRTKHSPSSFPGFTNDQRALLCLSEIHFKLAGIFNSLVVPCSGITRLCQDRRGRGASNMERKKRSEGSNSWLWKMQSNV